MVFFIPIFCSLFTCLTGVSEEKAAPFLPRKRLPQHLGAEDHWTAS